MTKILRQSYRYCPESQERIQPSESTLHPRSSSTVVSNSIPPLWSEVLERWQRYRQSERYCPNSKSKEKIQPSQSTHHPRSSSTVTPWLMSNYCLGPVFTEHQSFAQTNPDPFLKPSLIYLQVQIYNFFIMSGKNVLCKIYLNIFACKECQIKVQRYTCLP